MQTTRNLGLNQSELYNSKITCLADRHSNRYTYTCIYARTTPVQDLSSSDKKNTFKQKERKGCPLNLPKDPPRSPPASHLAHPGHTPPHSPRPGTTQLTPSTGGTLARKGKSKYTASRPCSQAGHFHYSAQGTLLCSLRASNSLLHAQ